MNKFCLAAIILFFCYNSQTAISQTSPCDTIIPLTNMIFNWQDYPGAVAYDFLITWDSAFNSTKLHAIGLSESRFTISNGWVVFSDDTCYYWRWKPVMKAGSSSWSSGCKFCTHALIGINNIHEKMPSEYMLNQNYPNPFNPETKITFYVKECSEVKLIIYNTIGEQIGILADGSFSQGFYEVKWNASKYPSGIYYYKMTAGDFIDIKKMIVLK
ncbi:MAG: T9SS C-terminal target domain-containing protein [Ignavibacteriae bacterium]|nr:MAG: T9SS C-terminal target domain-containing protein [Ignavibacteriota bacterium]